MANIHDCLQRAVDAGELDRIRASEARSEYEQLVDRYSQVMPRHQAEATAVLHLKEATQRAQRSRRHAVLNQLQSMTRLKALIEGAPDPAVALRNLLEHSDGSGFTGESVASLSEAMIRSVNAGLKDVLASVNRNLIGNQRQPALLGNIIRELHGEATGDAQAAALSQAVRHQQKRLRQMFNAHGGDIGQIADYGLPHSHSGVALEKAGFRAWADEIAPLLDWNRIIDKKTEQPFAAKGARPDRTTEEAFLRDIYNGIITRGMDNHVPTLSMGGKALYNRRAEPRILHFQNGSAWLEYNKRFGTSDPFSAMIGGLHGMARDVALMRVLGPNPRLGLEYASQVAKVRVALSDDRKLIGRVNRMSGRAKAMLAHLDGSVNNTEAEAWASFFGSTRQVLTSIQLGSAVLSSVTDLATISMAARVSGLNPTNVLGRTTQLMASAATREAAARMGYVADTLANTGSAAARFTGDVVAGDLTERLTDFTMRASGLSFWTDMNRISFQMEFAGFMADNADRAFDQIDAPLRKLFRQRGITAQDWDLLRDPDALFRTDKGATFLSPFHWLETQTKVTRAEAEGLAMRLQMAIQEQLEFAVPTASVEGQARMLGDAKPGTFLGELGRSSTMYKAFAISLTLNQVRRFMALPTPMSKAVYAAKMSAGLILLGGVAVQLKELAKGNDPRPMDRPEFWMGALFQGGGLGIFGDFFSSETSRTGGGIAETVAGPVVGAASDVIRPIASNVTRAIAGDNTFVGRDVANFVRYNTPVLSSLWQTRLAYDRLVADSLQSLLDPEAEQVWRRQMRQRERDYGTRSYWPRGASGPERAPDLSNALGDR